MNITVIDSTHSEEEGYFVQLSQAEALSLILSLTQQLQANSPNVGRIEMYTDSQNYFSIAVEPKTEVRSSRGMAIPATPQHEMQTFCICSPSVRIANTAGGCVNCGYPIL